MTGEYWDAKDARISKQWALNAAINVCTAVNNKRESGQLTEEELLARASILANSILRWLMKEA